VVPELAQLYQRYKDSASFAMVYVDEAHAQDEWPIGNHLNDLPNVARQPRTTEARLEVMHQQVLPFLRVNAPGLLPSFSSFSGLGDKEFDDLAGMSSLAWLLDPPELHLFEDVYAPWPLRFWIVQNGILKYIASPKNGQFSVEELEGRLRDALA